MRQRESRVERIEARVGVVLPSFLCVAVDHGAQVYGFRDHAGTRYRRADIDELVRSGVYVMIVDVDAHQVARLGDGHAEDLCRFPDLVAGLRFAYGLLGDAGYNELVIGGWNGENDRLDTEAGGPR